jgi:hypothetical protein
MMPWAYRFAYMDGRIDVRAPELGCWMRRLRSKCDQKPMSVCGALNARGLKRTSQSVGLGSMGGRTDSERSPTASLSPPCIIT